MAEEWASRAQRAGMMIRRLCEHFQLFIRREGTQRTWGIWGIQGKQTQSIAQLKKVAHFPPGQKGRGKGDGHPEGHSQITAGEEILASKKVYIKVTC